MFHLLFLIIFRHAGLVMRCALLDEKSGLQFSVFAGHPSGAAFLSSE
jgi:hypothetical protein